MNAQKKNKWLLLAMVLGGNMLYALSVKLFILPGNLVSCGTTGIALVVNHMLGVPISLFILIFNLIMLALGWWVMGRQFAMTTVLSSLFYPVALAVLNQVLGDVVITEDLFLNALFGGMGLGLSLGIVVRAGASTGGMDIPPHGGSALRRDPDPGHLHHPEQGDAAGYQPDGSEDRKPEV